METVAVTKDIDITCQCTECERILEIHCTSDVYGDISIDVEPCKCEKDEEL